MTSPAAEHTEPPRRRSTVREPAPFLSSVGEPQSTFAPEVPAAPAAPEPSATTPAPAEEAKPRRFGWWSKRG
jgi:ribonuclease E